MKKVPSYFELLISKAVDSPDICPQRDADDNNHVVTKGDHWCGRHGRGEELTDLIRHTMRSKARQEARRLN